MISFPIVFLSGCYVFWKTKSITRTRSKAILIYLVFASVALASFGSMKVVTIPGTKQHKLCQGLHRLFIYLTCLGIVVYQVSFKKYQVQLNAQLEETKKIIEQVENAESTMTKAKFCIFALFIVGTWFRTSPNTFNVIVHAIVSSSTSFVFTSLAISMSNFLDQFFRERDQHFPNSAVKIIVVLLGF